MRFRPLLWALLLVLLGSVPAPGEESVTIPGTRLYPDVPARVVKPDGGGPFPAVVILHDCSGLGAQSSGAADRWAVLLLAHGYVVALPDSFTPRGFPAGICTEPLAEQVFANSFEQAADAYHTAAYLRSLPYVDPRHVGVMGGSHGGSATLAAMVALDRTAPQLLVEEKRHGLAAGVALYPDCGARYGDWAVWRARDDAGPIVGTTGVYRPLAPLLILIGGRDDWTPAAPCRRLAEGAAAHGFPVDIKVYPEARHSFDSDKPVRYVAARTNINAAVGTKGATTGGDPAAWSDARQRILAFFAEHLGG
jgi:dienelactone hydrolase